MIYSEALLALRVLKQSARNLASVPMVLRVRLSVQFSQDVKIDPKADKRLTRRVEAIIFPAIA